MSKRALKMPPSAVNKLFSGENNGKLVIQTSKEP
jgi:NADPH-dependent curcumin reductase CurA